MEDNDRMIAAARRLARRMARTTDMSYQQALDKVARDLGREHWAAYTANPVEVPREITIAPKELQQGEDARGLATMIDRRVRHDEEASKPYGITQEEWNLPEGQRKGEFGDMSFVPGWNALSGEMLPPVGNRRTAYLRAMADILIPPREGPAAVFDGMAREVLAGMLGLEAIKADREGRTASIPTLVEWIMNGFRKGSILRDVDDKPGEDPMRDWIWSMLGQASGQPGSVPVARALGPLVDMDPNMRAGVLGAMDRGLLVFRNARVSELNA